MGAGAHGEVLDGPGARGVVGVDITWRRRAVGIVLPEEDGHEARALAYEACALRHHERPVHVILATRQQHRAAAVGACLWRGVAWRGVTTMDWRWQDNNGQGHQWPAPQGPARPVEGSRA